MPNTWQETVTAVPDPLKGLHGQPLIAGAGHRGLPGQPTVADAGLQSSYAGRVVVEVFDGGSTSDANRLAYSVDAVGVARPALLQRVAAALPVLLSQGGGASPDPLPQLHGRPLVGVERPGRSYVGRVVIELWNAPGVDDTQQLTYAVDAANGDNAAVVQRAAAALPIRLSSVSHP